MDSLTGLDGGGGKGKSREGRDGRSGSLRAGGEEGSDDSDNVRCRLRGVVGIWERNLFSFIRYNQWMSWVIWSERKGKLT